MNLKAGIIISYFSLFCKVLWYNSGMSNLENIQELINNKEFEKAKKELLLIVKEDEKNIEALKLLGLCYINLNDFKEGQSVFETVIKYNDDATSWFYLANCYDNLDDYIRAIAAYEEVLRLRSEYTDAYKNLAIVYVKNKEPQKAIETARKALDYVKDDYTVYYIAGTACMALKDFDQAVEFFEKAIELNPEHSQLYNNLGTCYVTTNNLDKAYENFLKASQYDSKNSITYFNIGSILQIQNKHEEACEFFKKAYSTEPQDNYLTALALSEVKANRLEDAIEHYKTLAAHHPEKPNFQYNLACCYDAVGEYANAILILAQLVMLNPKSVSMLRKLANIYVKVGKFLNAKELYEKILLQGNVSHEIYYEFAHLCVKTGDLDKAEKILKKVIELKPEFARAHKDLGVLYMNKRLFDYAEDEFKKALEKAPDDFDIVFEYANYLHSTTNFKEADNYYEKALELNPHDTEALGFCALNKMLLGDLDTAWKQMEHALHHSQDDGFMCFVAGKIKFLQKDFETAKMYFIKSYELEKASDTEQMLGLCYFELGNFEQANGIFKHLLETNPMNINLMLNSAKCYDKMKDKDSALKTLEQIVEILPECEEAQEMIRAIS